MIADSAARPTKAAPKNPPASQPPPPQLVSVTVTWHIAESPFPVLNVTVFARIRAAISIFQKQDKRVFGELKAVFMASPSQPVKS
jgi:hypothetical protein